MGGGRATPPAVTDAARRRSTTGPRANIGHRADDQPLLRDLDRRVLRRSRVPHFHARDGSGRAKIRIDEVEVIESAMQLRQLRLVLARAELHQSELLENWRRARAGETLLDIEPLR